MHAGRDRWGKPPRFLEADLAEEPMDELTRQVSEMYGKYPYPSPQAKSLKLKELRNLLSIFSMENGYDMKSKSVLDAGTGTGHRLIEAASVFRDTRFLAVDISETSLRIAREIAA